jgi:putative Mn2+ efflux pump MntP
MFSLETTILGVALALDAAIASFAIGMLNLEISFRHKFIRGALTCILFGLFQAIMMWLGSVAGYHLSFSSVGYLFQLIVSSIFIGIGTKVLKESFEEEEKKIFWGLLPLLVVAFATSVDALLAGISIGTLPMPHLTSIEVGFITLILCAASYSCSLFFKTLPDKWILRGAGLVFFFLGGRVLYEHFL